MGLDIRDSVEANMKNFREEIIDTVKNLKHKYGVKSATEIMFHLPPCPCSKEGIDAIERAALETNIKAKKMNSGAGHDAMTIAERVKIGMIFVPSVNGISHSPLEWTNWEDIEKGIKVTTQVLKNLSRL
jgi:acetylornithine deacetylase/succinyl-diaminopimelate desuccinylase-like protein